MILHPANWQRRRGVFNHDWLKNSFLQGLSSWLNLLDDRIEDKKLERSFVEERLPEWEERLPEVRSLPHDFVTQMSPRTLFDVEPLCRCSEETKSWLPELVHQLWMVRCNVASLVAEAEKAVETAQTAYQSLQERLRTAESVTTVACLRPFRPEFETFFQACGAVAKAIEKFPSRIMVV